MASQIAMSMMRKRRMGASMPEPDEHMMEDGDISGHPHKEPQHQEMDRQHAYDEAHQALQSLAKDGMPGAEDMSKQLQKSWSAWQGEMKPMQPATKMSHRASPVSKSPMDEQDENMYEAEKYDASKDSYKE